MFDLNLTCVVFLVMFGAFMVALKDLVLKPIGKALEQRQLKIRGDIEAGSAARAKAAEIVGDYQKRIHSTRLEAQGIVNDVLAKAQQARQTELKRIHDEGQARLQAAKKEIAGERAALLNQLAEDEKGLVTTIVRKLLGDSTSVFVDTDKARQVLLEEAS